MHTPDGLTKSMAKGGIGCARPEDAPIEAPPAQLLFIELKVDEREAFPCSLYAMVFSIA